MIINAICGNLPIRSYLDRTHGFAPLSYLRLALQNLSTISKNYYSQLRIYITVSSMSMK